MSVWFVRFLRCLGWIVGSATVAAVLAIILFQSLPGPTPGQSFVPEGRILACMRASIVMALSATLIALILAAPIAAAISISAPNRLRQALTCLTILPLLTMPSIFGYAWMLLATSRLPIITAAMHLIGWNQPGAGLYQSAFVLATWLWPIPVLIFSIAFKLSGCGAYQLALLDASPLRAFVRGALPELIVPGISACSIVFLLALLDPTIPPLVNTTKVWSVEMLAQAAAASKFERPVGYLFWMAWPMLVLIAAGVLLILPGLRQMSSRAESDEAPTSSALRNRANGLSIIAITLAATLALLPFAVFCLELWSGRQSSADALRAAVRTIEQDGLASLIASLLAAIFSAALTVAVLDEADWPRWRRVAAKALFIGVLILAAMPPEMFAAALICIYGQSDPRTWNIYDDSPLVWAAAITCRFAFIPVCAARILTRRWGREIDAMARVDGANRLQRLTHARLPMLAGILVATSALVLLLGMSEAAVSVLVQPVRFFGGSLAVQIDSQMHYGRQNQTIASALLMILPPVLGAATVLVGLKSIRMINVKRRVP